MEGNIRVRTRDNRLAPFDPARIVAAILEAMAESGIGDRHLADELAAAVTHFLRSQGSDASRPDRVHAETDSSGEPIHEVDAIQDMVEKVLMETGHRRIARSYVLLREKRARVRELIEVRESEEDRLDPPSSLTVEGRLHRRAQPWDRRRIAQALMEEADLTRGAAEQVAQAVEGRVFRSGLRSISTTLLRELVDNELFERGWTSRLRRQASVAIPKFDLERILLRGGDRELGVRALNPAHVSGVIGDLIIRQYMLDEVYTGAVRDAYLSGELHLHQLDTSLRLLSVSLDAEPFLESCGRPAGTGEFFGDLLSAARPLLNCIAEEIEIGGLGEALLAERLCSALDARRSGKELLRALESFHAFRVGLHRATPTVVLRIPFTPRMGSARQQGGLFGEAAHLEEETSRFLVNTFEHALAELQRRPSAAEALTSFRFKLEVTEHTFADRRFRTTLAAVVRDLPPEVELTFEPGPRVGRPPATGPDPDCGVEVLAGKVTINLPRIALALRARRKSAGGSEGILEGLLPDPTPLLERAVELATEALVGRAAFLSRLALLDPEMSREIAHPQRSLPLLSRARSVHAIGIIGLDDAVRIHTGRALHETEESAREGQRWTRILAQAVAAQPRAAELALTLEETMHRGPLRRFESLDREHHVDSGTVSDGTDGQVGNYSSGVRLHHRAPVDPLEGWLRLEPYRRWIRLLDRLDGFGPLRAEGPEVLMAFLEEVVRHHARQAALDEAPRDAHVDAAPAVRGDGCT